MKFRMHFDMLVQSPLCQETFLQILTFELN
jgi:hypothetical protein